MLKEFHIKIKIYVYVDLTFDSVFHYFLSETNRADFQPERFVGVRNVEHGHVSDR